MHQAAIAFCIDEPSLIDSSYTETVKWLTTHYNGDHLYDMIPMKSKRQ